MPSIANPWQVPWSDEELAMLRRLWADNLPTKAIAIALSSRRGGAHRSKNAVIGAAHRLGLPSRPSPILPKPGTAGTQAPPAARAAAIARPATQATQPPAELREAAIRAYRDGKPLAEAAAIAGVHPSTVWSWCERLGQRRPRDPRIIAPRQEPPAPKPDALRPPAPPAALMVPRKVQAPRRCQYPIETDGTPRYRFCDAPVFEGAARRTSYCEEHYRLCRLPLSSLAKKEAANA